MGVDAHRQRIPGLTSLKTWRMQAPIGRPMRSRMSPCSPPNPGPCTSLRRARASAHRNPIGRRSSGTRIPRTSGRTPCRSATAAWARWSSAGPTRRRSSSTRTRYWSGGPYSTTVRGGYEALPEIRRLLFDGAADAGPPPVRPAPDGLPRRAAEVPVARQPGPEARGQRRGERLSPRAGPGHGRRDDDATRAEASASGARSSSARWTRSSSCASRPTRRGRSRSWRSCAARATRPTRTTPPTTSRWTATGTTASSCAASRRTTSASPGSSATSRGSRRLIAEASCGSSDDRLVVRHADEVTLRLAAATSFVSYKDVSADPGRARGRGDAGGRGQALRARSVRSTCASTSGSSAACP